jgi:transcriptional regulator with XRE-family HTH domain
MEKTLGQHLTALRESKGLTQEDLADKSGISRPQISRLENDEVDAPRRTTLVKLATALGVGIDEIQADYITKARPAMVVGRFANGQDTVDAAVNAVLKSENEFLKAENARLWEMLGKSSSSLGAALAGLFGAGQQVSTVLAA